MIDRSIAICGFPESGKTTYLAALWHLVTANSHDLALRFGSLLAGDNSHLNELATRWRKGLTQRRTDGQSKLQVSMNLLDHSDTSMRITFPDLSGESYRAMFEDRDCAPVVAEVLKRGEGMLFLVHADKIRQPHLVVDVASQSEALGAPIPAGQERKWSPELAPTQVKVVELLQLLRLSPLNVPFSKISIVLSAWDKVIEEGRTPEEFLAERLPLVDQYLKSAADGWAWRVYGVSAQGGDYEKENETLLAPQLERLQQLRALDEPSARIRVIYGNTESCDLTEPIAWLMG